MIKQSVLSDDAEGISDLYALVKQKRMVKTNLRPKFFLSYHIVTCNWYEYTCAPAHRSQTGELYKGARM